MSAGIGGSTGVSPGGVQTSPPQLAVTRMSYSPSRSNQVESTVITKTPSSTAVASSTGSGAVTCPTTSSEENVISRSKVRIETVWK